MADWHGRPPCSLGFTATDIERRCVMSRIDAEQTKSCPSRGPCCVPKDMIRLLEGRGPVIAKGVAVTPSLPFFFIYLGSHPSLDIKKTKERIVRLGRNWT